MLKQNNKSRTKPLHYTKSNQIQNKTALTNVLKSYEIHIIK